MDGFTNKQTLFLSNEILLKQKFIFYFRFGSQDKDRRTMIVFNIIYNYLLNLDLNEVMKLGFLKRREQERTGQD